MKYLIFSDTHGQSRGMMDVIERNIPLGIDGVLFLGDGLADLERVKEKYPDLSYHAVAGNCDVSARYIGAEWREKLLEVEKVRILMMHGHFHNVKSSIDYATAYARRMEADVLLYGHTHEPLEQYLPMEGSRRALYVFNPGSAYLPRYGAPTFGTLTVRNGAVLLSHGNIQA